MLASQGSYKWHPWGNNCSGILVNLVAEVDDVKLSFVYCVKMIYKPNMWGNVFVYILSRVFNILNYIVPQSCGFGTSVSKVSRERKLIGRDRVALSPPAPTL